ncbi:uncharacterized protein K452DRAFT_200449, partial [Aplosporella prunicola CBS 121167]
MAANDYYNPRRADAPLPPLPPPSPQPVRPQVDTQNLYNNSPIMHSNPASAQSPFDDRSYPAYPNPSHNPYGPDANEDTAYHGNAGMYGQPPHPYEQTPTDPFGDSNAIPLHSQNPKLEASPSRYNADPEYQYPLVGDPAQRKSDRRRHKKRKQGWFTGKITWVVFILTLVEICVFIAEIARNAILTGSPIMIHPYFNPMIGPSPYVYITMGARYVPCMRHMGGNNEINITPQITFPCPNTTSSTATECSLAEACGMSGIPDPSKTNNEWHPNQWYRFITPIFLHAGLIHIALNMLMQLTIGRDMELLIGSVRFALVYFASGIFGNVLGANYAANGMPSTGASGALFGLIGLTILDLFYHWGERQSPWKELLFIMIDVVITFVIGLLPGVDNFAHLGGLIMGIGLGITLLHSPAPLRERIGQKEPPYSAVSSVAKDDDSGEGIKVFTKQPMGFFKGRKPLWWAWWLFRAGCLVAVIVGFIVLLNNFYFYHNQCSWCKHISCLPVKNWCEMGNLEYTNTTQSSSKRDLLGV